MKARLLIACLLAFNGWFAASLAANDYQPLPAGTIVDGELGREIDAYMKKCQAEGFSGSLLVIKDGKPIICKGYGFADIVTPIPYTSETVIEIGSITKQFTAAAILRLEMDGKLSVNDPITKFFKNVPPDKQGITLHHLLTHSSRIRNGFGGDYDLKATRDWIVEQALASKLLPGEIGKDYTYSNAGYSLLGAVVEIASGMGYEHYMREHIFKPAGMMHTGYQLPDWSGMVIARGVARNGKDWGTPREHPWLPDGPCWNLRANGGMLTTLADLYRWHLALENNTVLSAEAREKFETGYVQEGPRARSKYAYGWAIFTTRWGTKLVAHNGGNGIFFCDFRRFVEDDSVIVIASNKSTHSAEKYEGELVKIIWPILRTPREN